MKRIFTVSILAVLVLSMLLPVTGTVNAASVNLMVRQGTPMPPSGGGGGHIMLRQGTPMPPSSGGGGHVMLRQGTPMPPSGGGGGH
jgi:hypothetical protein